MFRYIRIACILTAGAFLASCTLGRDYKRPAIETPSTYRFAAAEGGTASLADLQWFELFRDERGYDAVPGLLSREVLRPCGFAEATEPPPHVELPPEAEASLNVADVSVCAGRNCPVRTAL